MASTTVQMDWLNRLALHSSSTVQSVLCRCACACTCACGTAHAWLEHIPTNNSSVPVFGLDLTFLLAAEPPSASATSCTGAVGHRMESKSGIFYMECTNKPRNERIDTTNTKFLEHSLIVFVFSSRTVHCQLLTTILRHISTHVPRSFDSSYWCCYINVFRASKKILFANRKYSVPFPIAELASFASGIVEWYCCYVCFSLPYPLSSFVQKNKIFRKINNSNM